MSLPNELMPVGLLGNGASAYQIQRSLRFNSADSAYLSRTPASAGNSQTWTWAGWVKRCSLGSVQALASSNNDTVLLFDASDRLCLYFSTTFNNYVRVTTQVFRDVSAWYHIVFASDTSNATAQNRARFYVNGIEVTTWSTNITITQNYYTAWNAALAHQINANNTVQIGNVYLADVHSIDGQALDPTSFGEFDANGIWQPKAYSGSYGTNGFKLDFADNASTTTIGYDAAGSNDWTANNLSVTAGSDNDSLVDSPTNYGTDTGAGGEVRGNYCTLNPLEKGSNQSLSNGNLVITATSQLYGAVRGTVGMSSGKWYWEQTLQAFVGADIQLGMGNSDSRVGDYIGSSSRSYGFSSNNTKWNSALSGGSGAYTTSWVAGDIIGLAFDADAGTLTLYKNGSSLGTAFSSIPADTYFPMAGAYNTSSTSVLNFGQRPFAYTAPSGFKALCTANLPPPTITKGSSVMDVVTYTGTGSALTPTSTLGFSPDLVWIKGRSGATDNTLYDTVRGVEARLESNTTDAEVTSDDGLTAFNSNGFTLGTLAQVNTNTATYAGWCWDGGSSTVTNTSGTISSQVRANASAGFSVVTFTMGSGSNTVGHGLNAVPGLVICTTRNGTSNWWAFMDPTLGSDKYLSLQKTDAAATLARGTSTSSVFAVDNNFFNNTLNHVAYCFAPVAGYSAFGSYTGNGSADGPFVYTSHLPKLILIKRTDTTSNWTILDTSREGYNVDNDPLYPNLADAEGTADLLDITSNGFKLRSTDASVNASGGTYIYASWASSPFNYSRAR